DGVAAEAHPASTTATTAHSNNERGSFIWGSSLDDPRRAAPITHHEWVVGVKRSANQAPAWSGTEIAAQIGAFPVGRHLAYRWRPMR
ncbi:MAG: hypothetical protein ACXWMN_00965, partial [Candidatus Limnocylindria bacterium]